MWDKTEQGTQPTRKPDSTQLDPTGFGRVWEYSGQVLALNFGLFLGSGRCPVGIESYKYTTSTRFFFFWWKKTLLFVVLSSAKSRSEYPSESSWVKDQESSWGNVVALVAIAEEEEALIGALDF